MACIRGRTALVVLVLLSLTMAMTRFGQTGSVLGLGDASWAVFFLAGFYLRPILVFVLLLAEAGLVDYLSIDTGTSSWCATPAYFFLLPAYGCLWYAGRQCSEKIRPNWRGLIRLAAILFFAIFSTFLITNASFYAFSGYFDELTVIEYSAKVAQYLPSYILTAFGYVFFAACLHWLCFIMKSNPIGRRIAEFAVNSHNPT